MHVFMHTCFHVDDCAKKEIAARRASQEATESGRDCRNSCFLMQRGVVLGLPLCTRLLLRSEEDKEHGLEKPSLRKKIRNSTGLDLLFLRAERSANAIGAIRASRNPPAALVVVADCALSPPRRRQLHSSSSRTSFFRHRAKARCLQRSVAPPLPTKSFDFAGALCRLCLTAHTVSWPPPLSTKSFDFAEAFFWPPSATLRRSSSSHKVLRLCGSPFNRGYGGKLSPRAFRFLFTLKRNN